MCFVLTPLQLSGICGVRVLLFVVGCFFLFTHSLRLWLIRLTQSYYACGESNKRRRAISGTDAVNSSFALELPSKRHWRCTMKRLTSRSKNACCS